jgi:hypothetical protein
VFLKRDHLVVSEAEVLDVHEVVNIVNEQVPDITSTS